MLKPVVLAAALATVPLIAALAQPAPEPVLTTEIQPLEILTARRVLMDTIGRNNDYLHDSVDGHYEWDPVGVSARLDAISTMLLVFPHLYDPGTHIWSEELEQQDAAMVSLSTPEVWEEFDVFHALSLTASDTALRASLAQSKEEAIELIEALEVQCDACHDRYRQHRTSGREDLSSGE